jgi:hypothetical protein
VLLSGQKITFGLLATITLEAVTFRAYALLPPLLAFVKCTLEVVFCVFLRFCLDQLNYVKMAALQFYLQSGKERKVGWFGTTVMLYLVKTSLLKCEAVRCRNATASSFFMPKSSHIFTQSP